MDFISFCLFMTRTVKALVTAEEKEQLEDLTKHAAHWRERQRAQSILWLRHRIKRAVRRTCCFSKKVLNHVKAFNLGFFYINHGFV